MVHNPCNTRENEIAALAKRQHGFLTRRQLRQLGLREGAIEWRLKQGRLIPVHAGVYALGHLPALALDRAHAALLACGREAVLSHDSAAWIWGLHAHFRQPFEVTTPKVKRRPGVIIHRAALDRDDVRHNRGFRVTSPARTALDLAPRLTSAELERMVDDLRTARHLRLEQLASVLARYRRHPGAPALRAIAESSGGPSRSDWELAFLEFVERHDLPMPRINAKVGRYEVDALFAAERVIVELDSWRWHSSRTSFRRDRKRDAALLARGFVTVRLTWERLETEAEAVAAELRAILDRQRRLLGSSV